MPPSPISSMYYENQHRSISCHAMPPLALYFTFILLDNNIFRKKKENTCLLLLFFFLPYPNQGTTKAIILTIMCFNSHLDRNASKPVQRHSNGKRLPLSYVWMSAFKRLFLNQAICSRGHYSLRWAWQGCPSRGPCISDNKHRQLCQRAAVTCRDSFISLCLLCLLEHTHSFLATAHCFYPTPKIKTRRLVAPLSALMTFAS